MSEPSTPVLKQSTAARNVERFSCITKCTFADTMLSLCEKNVDHVDGCIKHLVGEVGPLLRFQ